MPLGFSPLTSGPTGSSIITAPTSTTSSGVAVPVLGLPSTTSLGTATANVGSGIHAEGVQATATLGRIGINTPNMTTVLLGSLSSTCSIGAVAMQSAVDVVADSLVAIAVQGSIENVAVGSVVLSGLEITTGFGEPVASTPQRWVEIVPASTPGWTNVTIT